MLQPSVITAVYSAVTVGFTRFFRIFTKRRYINVFWRNIQSEMSANEYRESSLLLHKRVVMRSSATAEHSASVAEARTACWNHYVTTATLVLRFGRAQHYMRARCNRGRKFYTWCVFVLYDSVFIEAALCEN